MERLTIFNVKCWQQHVSELLNTIFRIEQERVKDLKHSSDDISPRKAIKPLFSNVLLGIVLLQQPKIGSVQWKLEMRGFLGMKQHECIWRKFFRFHAHQFGFFSSLVQFMSHMYIHIRGIFLYQDMKIYFASLYSLCPILTLFPKFMKQETHVGKKLEKNCKIQILIDETF